MTTKVALDRSGRRVRLRGTDVPLPITLDREGKEPIRCTLVPNRWTDVPDEVYAMLKQKFGAPKEHSVPDWDEGTNAPNTRRDRVDVQENYVIEGLE